jgi:hypothetical protein
LSYQENCPGVLARPQGLQVLKQLKTLENLELEFFGGPEDKPLIFDSLLLPGSLKRLKLIFGNCRYMMLEESKSSQKFFRNLSELNHLKEFDFEAYRLSLMRE